MIFIKKISAIFFLSISCCLTNFVQPKQTLDTPSKLTLKDIMYRKGDLPPITGENTEQEISQILTIIQSDRVKFIELEFSDIDGNPKSFTLPADNADRIKKTLENGIYFDGSSVQWYTSVSNSDCLLRGDLRTFHILPWTQGDEKTARIIADVHYGDGTPHVNCPRIILKRFLQQAKSLGFTFYVSAELEFYLIKKGDNHSLVFDGHGYSDSLLNDVTRHAKLEILTILNDMGLNPEKTHHEVAPSQHEITMLYGDALEVADRIITVKNIIRAIANKYDFHAVFMPKPFFGENGSGMHIHYSLFDIKKQVNAFYDPIDPNLLSTTAKHFIAGNLKHAREFSAIFNPTVNSYKRLVLGYEAPVYICWGNNNRSALIRKPAVNKDDSNAVRVEIRSPDPLCNPYLAFAALLISGLEGIKNEEPFPGETSDNLFILSAEEIAKRRIKTLPSSLAEAIALFEHSELAERLCGNNLHRYYVERKTKEAADFAMAVTDWELKKYW